MGDIERLLQQSDKAEVLEWLIGGLPRAEKCLIVVAEPDDDGGLVMRCCQFGHQYNYELVGFVDWVRRFVDEGGFCWGDEDEEAD